MLGLDNAGKTCTARNHFKKNNFERSNVLFTIQQYGTRQILKFLLEILLATLNSFLTPGFFSKRIFFIVLLADFYYQSDYFENTVIRSIVGQNLDNIAPTVGFSKVEHKYKVRPTVKFSQKLNENF
jgi:hypothetical protein